MRTRSSGTAAGRWTARDGCSSRRAAGCGELLSIFYNPDLPTIDDYGDPWTYDYQTLIQAPPGTLTPSAHSISALTGKDMRVRWGSNWDDDLAGGPATPRGDPDLAGLGEQVKLAFEQVFMFYLPRICEHCLNPSCVASCPSGAMYKREEDGIVLVDQDRCRGWRFCVSGCPYKKVYFNHRTGKAEKCTLCFPRIEAGQPTICSETCVGRLRYLGPGPLRRRRRAGRRRHPGPAGSVPRPAVGVPRPRRPGRCGPRPPRRASPPTGWTPPAAPPSTR